MHEKEVDVKKMQRADFIRVYGGENTTVYIRKEKRKEN